MRPQPRAKACVFGLRGVSISTIGWQMFSEGYCGRRVRFSVILFIQIARLLQGWRFASRAHIKAELGGGASANLDD